MHVLYVELEVSLHNASSAPACCINHRDYLRCARTELSHFNAWIRRIQFYSPLHTTQFVVLYDCFYEVQVEFTKKKKS